MTEWQPLDVVLQREMPGAVPTPPPIIKPKSNRRLVIAVVAAALLIFTAMVIGGVVALRLASRVRRVARLAVAKSRPGRESALTLASKPVQWTSNTLTVAEIREKGKEFRIRQYLEGYEKGGDHDAPYDADAVQLIKIWIDSNYEGELQTNHAVVAEMCDKLAANPACNDPLLLTMVGANTDELQEAARRFERALKSYEHSRYKAYPKFCATVLLAGKLVDLQRDHNRVRELDGAAQQLLKEALQDDSIRPADQPEIAEILINGWGRGFLVRNAAAIPKVAQDAGKPYQWLALTLEGEHHIMAAWTARGGGYANTVTAEGWKGFHEHLVEARKYLTKAWELRPDFPLAASRMMDVALGSSDIEEMRLWFDRAVAAQVDHRGVWKNMRWGLRPRWFGSQDAMLAFGVMAADTRRYDTDVPRNLFDSITDLEAELELPLGEHIYGRNDIWPHVQQMYEGYVAEPSQAKTRDGWRSTYSIVAFLAGKYDVSRAQLEAIDWQPWRGNLTGWGRDLSLMPLEVAARTGAMKQEVDTAESWYKKGSLATALRLYTELSAATNIDQRTREFVQERLTTIETEQRLQAGEWTDFLPSGGNLPGWTVERGKCKELPDGALEVQSDKWGHIVSSRARVGCDFEVRGTFEVAQSSTEAFQAGLVFGMPQFGASGWCSFRMKRNVDEGDVASFADGWTTRQLRNPVVLNKGTNTFSFRLQKGLVSATVNGKEVFKNAKPPEHTSLPTNAAHLGLGAYNDTNDTVIRYRNVQVRKLSSR